MPLETRGSSPQRSSPLNLQKRTPFVGRADEMAVLSERLEAAALGRGFPTMVGYCSEIESGAPFTGAGVAFAKVAKL